MIVDNSTVQLCCHILFDRYKVESIISLPYLGNYNIPIAFQYFFLYLSISGFIFMY